MEKKNRKLKVAVKYVREQHDMGMTKEQMQVANDM